MKVVIGGEDEPGPAVQAYLDGLSRSELHELVLTLAECSETVRRTLEAVAELAGERRGGAGEDPVRRAAALLSAQNIEALDLALAGRDVGVGQMCGARGHVADEFVGERGRGFLARSDTAGHVLSYSRAPARCSGAPERRG